MEQIIARLLGDFESGRMNRRQLLRSAAITATAASAVRFTRAASFAEKAGGVPSMSYGEGFKAVAYNHISYVVPDYVKTRDFFVNLFGMKVAFDDGKQCSVEFGDPPNAIYIRALNPGEKEKAVGPNGPWAAQMGQGYVNHLAFSIENFDLAAVKSELTRRGLNPQPDGPFAWSIKDPSGYTLQICATKGVFPGQASPTAKESDGTKNLAAIPGPDGKGFKAYAVSHLVMQVADVDKNHDFYTDLLGMKVIYYKPGDMAGVDNRGGPVCFLRFGENTLYFRKSQHPEKKTYVAHFAPLVENYDAAAVKAELTRRGLKPQPDTKYGWSVQDPSGMRIEVAGKGLPEHIGGDCNGSAEGCPGGPEK